MEYPLKIELDLEQDDFIQVDILEQYLDSELYKSDSLKAFKIQILVLAIFSGLFFAFRTVVAVESQFLILAFAILFALNFLYRYFIGYKTDLKLGLNHLLLSNQEGHSFFAPEKGMVLFFEDRCEYLTNEQRRFFSYDHIKHIKVTKHLYVFVLDQGKDKSLRGFLYMIIPKRNMDSEQAAELESICEKVSEKFDLKPWMGKTILD